MLFQITARSVGTAWPGRAQRKLLPIQSRLQVRPISVGMGIPRYDDRWFPGGKRAWLQQPSANLSYGLAPNGKDISAARISDRMRLVKASPPYLAAAQLFRRSKRPQPLAAMPKAQSNGAARCTEDSPGIFGFLWRIYPERDEGRVSVPESIRPCWRLPSPYRTVIQSAGAGLSLTDTPGVDHSKLGHLLAPKPAVRAGLARSELAPPDSPETVLS